MSRRSSKQGPVLKSGGRDARKTAALVLEVLSGELHTSEAAEALGVGLPRFYQIEKRALEGLLKACEPAERKGRRKSESVKIKELELELKTKDRDMKRAQALLRAAQKTSGISTVVSNAVKRKEKNGRKRRKPQSRGHKIAKSLMKEQGESDSEMPINTEKAFVERDQNGTRTNDERREISGQNSRVGNGQGATQGSA